MKGNFVKGTEEFTYFGDMYNYRKEFWEIEPTDEWWERFMKAGEKLIEKYKNTYFAELVVNDTSDFYSWQDRKGYYGKTNDKA